MTNSPGPIPIPPVPELDPPDEETNTLALLLPNQALFQPSILSLLKDHYNLFGEIIHWAPVKGFGRVIIVFKSNEDAGKCKRLGDWLKLDLTPTTPMTGEGGNEQNQVGDGDGNDNTIDNEVNKDEVNTKSDEYFTKKSRKSKRRSDILKSNELILRLHHLPPTPINPDPSTIFLAPPSLPHNFLISPPGSPPEGWEPILEEGPNTSILAEDLQRALESLQLNGGFNKNNGKEVILDEGGVRVEVEDTTKLQEGNLNKWDIDVEERLDGQSEDIWDLPKQNQIDRSHERNASLSGLSGLSGLGGLSGLSGLGGLSGSNTPSGKIKIAPTARPPM